MRDSALLSKDLQNTTFIIKTFERPMCVRRLVKSIFGKYPGAKVLIADDSKESCRRDIEKCFPDEDVTVYELDYDCGLAYGRNYLLGKVETEYFILLDDDFEFDEKTDIERGFQILKEKKLDILGGYFRNYRAVRNPLDEIVVVVQERLELYRQDNYIGTLELDESAGILHAHYIQEAFPEYTDTDITHNFFIAVTETIRERNLWDNELKLQEHTAFFVKAKKNGLKAGFANCLSVKHKPVRSKKYRKYRGRNYTKVFMELYGIQKFIATYDNGKTVVRDYDRL